jgi:hypothetical protein
MAGKLEITQYFQRRRNAYFDHDNSKKDYSDREYPQLGTIAPSADFLCINSNCLEDLFASQSSDGAWRTYNDWKAALLAE